MNHWASDGGFGLHVFHKNNELAGYCSVLHALALTGSTGDYGRRLSAVVIGFGATARGAVTALNAHGIHDVQVLTNRGVAAVGSPIHSVRIAQFDHDDEAPFLSEVITERGRVPLAPFLAESDIVVNCTLQDPNTPLTYLRTEDLAAFRPGSLIVDVSCDEGMGFSWAKTTTFAEPMFTVGDHIDYYAVDHSPSYLWNSSSWEISEALLPFLETVMSGPGGLGRERDHPPRDRNPRRRGPQPGCAAVPAAGGGVPARPAGASRDSAPNRTAAAWIHAAAVLLGCGTRRDDPQQAAPVLQVHLEHQLAFAGPARRRPSPRRAPAPRRRPGGRCAGPACSASQPIIGPPIAWPPISTMMYRLITRPRMRHVGADLDQLVGGGQEHQAPEAGQHHGRAEPHHATAPGRPGTA